MHTVTTSKQIGAALAGRRKQLELSQSEVAAKVGLSQNRLSELESRPETLTVEQLLALVHVLGLRMTLDVSSSAPGRKVEW